MVDSLPYIDNHLSKQTTEGVVTDKSLVKKVRKMIAEELQALEKLPQKNFLENLPVPSTPLLDDMINSNLLADLEEQMLGKRVSKTQEIEEPDIEAQLRNQITHTSQLSNQ